MSLKQAHIAIMVGITHLHQLNWPIHHVVTGVEEDRYKKREEIKNESKLALTEFITELDTCPSTEGELYDTKERGHILFFASETQMQHQAASGSWKNI